MSCVKLGTVPATRPGNVCCAAVFYSLQLAGLSSLRGRTNGNRRWTRFSQASSSSQAEGVDSLVQQILSEHLLGAGYSWGQRKTKA